MLTVFFGMVVGLGQASSPGCQPDCTVPATFVDTRISIDGNFEEPGWRMAAPASGFLQYTPVESAPASFHTEVRLLHDERTLYVGATMHDPRPAKIRRVLGRRDYVNSSDWFVLALDAFNDNRTAFHFAVNAAGVQVDGMSADNGQAITAGSIPIHVDAAFRFNSAWDAEWQASTRPDSSGWTAEIAIPLSQLPLTGGSRMHWGVNFQRIIARKAELDEWALVRTVDRGGGTVQRFGTVSFEAGIARTVRRSALLNLDVLHGVEYRAKNGERERVFEFAGGLPGAEFELTPVPAINLGMALVPRFTPEGFYEFLRWPSLDYSEQGGFVQGRVFSVAQQLLSTPEIAGIAPFHPPWESGHTYPILGTSSLHGRLTPGLTVAALSSVTASHDQAIRFGHAIRMTHDTGKFSRLGLTATVGPDGAILTQIQQALPGRIEREHLYSPAVASVDWDLRFKQNTHRLTGQFSLSRERHFLLSRRSYSQATNAEVELVETHDYTPWKANGSLGGFATRLNIEQLDRLSNGFGRAEIVADGYRVSMNGTSGYADRVTAAVGVSRVLKGGGRIIRKGRAAAEIAHRRTYTGFKSVSTSATGYATVLTGAFNRVTAAAGIGRLRSSIWQLHLDFAASTDARSIWVITPRIAATVRSDGKSSWGASGEIIGNLGSRMVLTTNIGIAHLNPVGADCIRANRTHRPFSGDSPAPFGRWPDYAFSGAWQSCLYSQDLYFGSNLGITIYRDLATVRASSRLGFGRVRAVLALLSNLDLEVGAALQATGERQPSNPEGQRVLISSRADTFLGIRWQFKKTRILSIGMYDSWFHEPSATELLRSGWDLFARPFGMARQRLYMFQYSRKIWR